MVLMITLQMQKANSLRDKIDEFQELGYCLLRAHLSTVLIDNCRSSFLPYFQKYMQDHGHLPNRGVNRHFLPMPFEPPCFVPDFFFDTEILAIIKNIMGDRVAADQWGCDVPVMGSVYQAAHIDYKRPLFQELHHLVLPTYMMVVSFGLTDITGENGAIDLHECRRCIDSPSVDITSGVTQQN